MNHRFLPLALGALLLCGCASQSAPLLGPPPAPPVLAPPLPASRPAPVDARAAYQHFVDEILQRADRATGVPGARARTTDTGDAIQRVETTNRQLDAVLRAAWQEQEAKGQVGDQTLWDVYLARENYLQALWSYYARNWNTPLPASLLPESLSNKLMPKGAQ